MCCLLNPTRMTESQVYAVCSPAAARWLVHSSSYLMQGPLLQAKRISKRNIRT